MQDDREGQNSNTPTALINSAMAIVKVLLLDIDPNVSSNTVQAAREDIFDIIELFQQTETTCPYPENV